MLTTVEPFSPPSPTTKPAALAHSPSTTSLRRRLPLPPPTMNPTLANSHVSTPPAPSASGTAPTQTRDNPLLPPITSNRTIINHAPQTGVPMPTFRQGRDRFPARTTRFHAPSTCNPNQYEVLPGLFSDFSKHWNVGRARRIDDTVIKAIVPEPMYSGIHYRIKIDPTGWGNQKVARGDIIYFRGFHSQEIRYLVTWKRAHEIEEGIAYIQVNAFRQDEYAVDASDADWPALGFYVPVGKCDVPTAPTPVFPCDSIHKRTIPLFGTSSNQTLPSAYNDYLNLANINRRNGLAPEPDSPPTTPPPSPMQRLKRKLSAISGIGRCGD